jgi:nucleotide-binding universal stress UspA family protein
MSSTAPHRRGRPVVVAIAGTAADRPTLEWAAEEAESSGRRLLLTHAAGHLPPEMSYAERHVARAEVRARSQQLLDDAAAWVHRFVPSVPVETMVRLLQPAALLPAVSGDASTVAQTAEAWQLRRTRHRSPVVAALHDAATDAHVLDFAADYADRRGVDLLVLEGHGSDASRRVVERSGTTSLVLVPRPTQPVGGGSAGRTGWGTTFDVLQHAESPVVLVSPEAG